MNIRNYPVWKWTTPQQRLVGTITAPPFPVGRKRSILYVVKEDHARGNGKSWRMFGTSQIDSQCAMLLPGSHVDITFLGVLPSEKNPAHTYFNFKIRVSTKGTGIAGARPPAAARAAPMRQRLARPLDAVGRMAGPRAAAKLKVVELKERGGGKVRVTRTRTPMVAQRVPLNAPSIPVPVPPRVELAQVTAPPPVPPPALAFNRDEWAKRIKKL